MDTQHAHISVRISAYLVPILTLIMISMISMILLLLLVLLLFNTVLLLTQTHQRYY